MTLRVLDLFSGIGGFSLGLERAGMRTVAFCEIDPFCRQVLRKHWADVPVYDNVRTLTADRLAADGIRVDLICGGFPCQDISVAGKGAGIEGERSGLWSEYARIIGEVRPRYVIVENVAALLGRGLNRVLGDLAALGFDAEWHCIPASAIGAPHRRDRIWIIAHTIGAGFVTWRRENARRQARHFPEGSMPAGNSNALANAKSGARQLRTQEREDLSDACGSGPIVADADQSRLERRRLLPECSSQRAARQSRLADTGRHEAKRYRPSFGTISQSNWWLSEPDVGRVAHGVPTRVDRLRSLGNAVVPQIPEMIGRAILEAGAA